MKRISSFAVNHNILEKGIYISREDMGIITYDIRMKKPNTGDVLDNGAIHTLEHLIATYVRNSAFSDKIIYFGPMGCRTGMYLIVRDFEKQKVIDLLKEAFHFCAEFEGEIPGSSQIECGNYQEHSLEGAKKEALDYLSVIKDYTVNGLIYE